MRCHNIDLLCSLCPKFDFCIRKLQKRVRKRYIIENDIVSGFYAGAEGERISLLSEAGDSVCFKAEIEPSSLLDGTEPVVVLAFYDKNQTMLYLLVTEGTKYPNEKTIYTAEIDVSKYNKNEIELKGFIWSGLDNPKPITNVSVLK